MTGTVLSPPASTLFSCRLIACVQVRPGSMWLLSIVFLGKKTNPASKTLQFSKGSRKGQEPKLIYNAEMQSGTLGWGNCFFLHRDASVVE